MSPQIISLVLFGGFAYFAFRMMSKRGTAPANLGAGIRTFLERSGYRDALQPTAPIEQQTQMMEERIKPMFTGADTPFELNLIRDFHGVPVKHYQSAESNPETGGRVFRANWAIRPTTPRVRWQAAAKSLTGAGKAIKEAFSNRNISWSPQFPTKVESGDRELDAKLNFYGESAAEVQRVLANPQLKAALLALEEPSLYVMEDEVSFSDPFQKNLLAGVGGTMGMMAIGNDPGKYYELTLPVHDRISELLVIAQKASA